MKKIGALILVLMLGHMVCLFASGELSPEATTDLPSNNNQMTDIVYDSEDELDSEVISYVSRLSEEELIKELEDMTEDR